MRKTLEVRFNDYHRDGKLGLNSLTAVSVTEIGDAWARCLYNYKSRKSWQKNKEMKNIQ